MSPPDRGRLALLLSGGGVLGFFHAGVIRALLAEGLLPRVIAGASAGALIAAIAGTRNDAALAALVGDDAAGIAATADEQSYTRMTGAAMSAMIDRLIPDLTFAEAEAASGRATVIAVAGPRARHGGLLCGPATTPDLLVRDVVLASCAVPFVFDAVALRERRADGEVAAAYVGRRWVDGSLYADVPAAALREACGVEHCIVSMVSPFVAPFVTDPAVDGPVLHEWVQATYAAGRAATRGWVAAAQALWSAVPAVEAMLDATQRMLAQDYDADMLLTPVAPLASIAGMFDAPGAGRVAMLAAEGEARTRARLAQVRALAATGLPAAGHAA